MSNPIEAWITESSAGRQNLATLILLIFGAAFVIIFRPFEGAAFTSNNTGFLLGIVMLITGAGMLLYGGKQIIAVEPKLKRIVVTQINRLRSSSREITFREISAIYVSESGDKEGGSIRYHVVAKLKTGKEVALFMGFFEASHCKVKMEAQCQRLIECILLDN